MDYQFLDEERKKLWARLESMEAVLEMKIPEAEAEVIKLLAAAKSQLDQINIESQKLSGSLKTVDALQSKTIEIASSVSGSEKYIATLLQNADVAISKIEGVVKDVESILGDMAIKHSSWLDFERQLSASKQQVEELDTLSNDASELASKIELVHKNVVAKKADIDQLHIEVFGYFEKDLSTGVDVPVRGKKDDLDDAYKILIANFEAHKKRISDFELGTFSRINDSLGGWQSDVEGIKEKLRGLLPEALTAGLSHAYSDQKEQEKQERFWHKVSFGVAIFGMILVSCIPFAVSVYYIYKLNLSLEDTLLKLPRLVLAIIPLYIPVLWIAYASSKKINLSKRLIEEYSHKEALSKTYEGLSTQIAGLDDGEAARELKVKLLYNILEVNSENPGKLISDYNKADHPVMDALEKSAKLTSSLERLARVPGFKKLAENLSDKTEKALSIQTQKVEGGLAAASVDERDA